MTKMESRKVSDAVFCCRSPAMLRRGGTPGLPPHAASRRQTLLLWRFSSERLRKGSLLFPGVLTKRKDFERWKGFGASWTWRCDWIGRGCSAGTGEAGGARFHRRANVLQKGSDLHFMNVCLGRSGLCFCHDVSV